MIMIRLFCVLIFFEGFIHLDAMESSAKKSIAKKSTLSNYDPKKPCHLLKIPKGVDSYLVLLCLANDFKEEQERAGKQWYIRNGCLYKKLSQEVERPNAVNVPDKLLWQDRKLKEEYENSVNEGIDENDRHHVAIPMLNVPRIDYEHYHKGRIIKKTIAWPGRQALGETEQKIFILGAEKEHVLEKQKHHSCIIGATMPSSKEHLYTVETNADGVQALHIYAKKNDSFSVERTIELSPPDKYKAVTYFELMKAVGLLRHPDHTVRFEFLDKENLLPSLDDYLRYKRVCKTVQSSRSSTTG
jgi:hypothetical protein